MTNSVSDHWLGGRGGALSFCFSFPYVIMAFASL